MYVTYSTVDLRVIPNLTSNPGIIGMSLFPEVKAFVYPDLELSYSLHTLVHTVCVMYSTYTGRKLK